MLQTPVLFIVFNRPDTTKIVFEAIRKAKPRQLFVAADGPRPDREGERLRCDEVRHIATAVDWDCELKTLFHTENLGCAFGPKTAIDWFFENVEQGIILEDDCLPISSFFNFCDELLNLYKFDETIFHISGLNLQHGLNRGRYSYYFSRVPHAWGWATWRRAWCYYDFNMSQIDALNLYRHEEFWISTFKSHIENNLDTWDYQWVYTILINNKISVTPNSCLITNLGFSMDATHTHKIPNWYEAIKVNNIEKIRHPHNKIISLSADKWVLSLFEQKPRLIQKLYFYCINILSKIYKNDE